MNTPFFLEILNGGVVTPELIWLCLLTVYLCKESKRRELHALDWFHLPPSMNLMVAIWVFDAASVLRASVVWAWRRFDGGGEFAVWQMGALMVCGAFTLIGSLCKIRAWTYPDHGNGPWLVSLFLTCTGIIWLIIFGTILR